MKSFPTQPRLHYFVLSSLILVSLRGVTSQDVISINYTGPAVVLEGTRITFTGTTTSAVTGNLPTSFSFFGKKENDSNIFQICSVDYGDCGASPTPPCYCTGQNNDTYNFTMEDTATLERSEVFIRGSVGGSDLARYPIITAQTTTLAPTTDPTTETTTGAGDHTDHTGEIVGGVCGGLAGIALGICIYCICKKKKVCCWKGAPVKTGDPSPTTVELGTTCNNGRATSQ